MAGGELRRVNHRTVEFGIVLVVVVVCCVEGEVGVVVAVVLTGVGNLVTVCNQHGVDIVFAGEGACIVKLTGPHDGLLLV